MLKRLINLISSYVIGLVNILKLPVFFGKKPSDAAGPSIIFFPYRHSLSCGLTGFIAFTGKDINPVLPDIDAMESILASLEQQDISAFFTETRRFFSMPDKAFSTASIMDARLCDQILKASTDIKRRPILYSLYLDAGMREKLKRITHRIGMIIEKAEAGLTSHQGFLDFAEIKRISKSIESLKDAKWCIENEVLKNIEKIIRLAGPKKKLNEESFFIIKQINAVLNSIDRIEVRGRDSAGISMFFLFEKEIGEQFLSTLDPTGSTDIKSRINRPILLNRGITSREFVFENNRRVISVALVYKVAKEIGALGENIGFIREQIRSDQVFQKIINLRCIHFSAMAHTRWASVGEISEANCHPHDNLLSGVGPSKGIIHVCLNGDIDNFQELKTLHEKRGTCFDSSVSCDAKIIPIHIQSYLNLGHDLDEAFRLAVNDFKGSHAICMISDLAPGSLFLALRGSGQSIFIGIGPNGYMPASEVYGFVEESKTYIKMEDKAPQKGPKARGTGQICILKPQEMPGISGIKSMAYDGDEIVISEQDIRETIISTRDIDRHDFPHFFLKEISESPESVRKTISARWRITDSENPCYEIVLDPMAMPQGLKKALQNKTISRIYFIGQGTAGVAAQACANILRFYLDSTDIDIKSMKSSELSGMVTEKDDPGSMENTLIIPISQSGTTTDTNRAVDIMKKLGAWSIAIVNRRDSELTFKTDGVFYTSSGRDIEMSVASTKAFYSQIIAGAILGLFIAGISGRRSHVFISNEIKTMLSIPKYMEQVLSMSGRIAESANRLALTREYWATVGSGANRAAADEIRIKLSELCYKTISSDYVEDKKHIDLSSEPLIIVCAAGTRRTMLGDIVKDTAIFRSHKAVTIVIADENDDRFTPYADDVIYVPHVPEHFSPLINTLAGHLWGYYAALAINDGSVFLNRFRDELSETIESFAAQKLDIYEIAIEKAFREKLARFYAKFRRRLLERRIPSIIGIRALSDIILLFKYLSGRLPVSDFELDFGMRGTAKNMIAELFKTLSASINTLARPIDAIKHQAKTVTVGTSRIEEKTEGLIFDAIKENGFDAESLTIANVLVIRNIQKIISSIKGMTLYRVSGINLLGEVTDSTRIEVIRKEGSSAGLVSRSETDPALKGTKRIIVREGNVYLGKGRRDNRSILIIPIMTNDAEHSNIIEYLMLFEVSFKKDLTTQDKVTALGGKHERIKNLVQESSISWKDDYLELLAVDDLFGLSAEKIAERIVSEVVKK